MFGREAIDLMNTDLPGGRDLLADPRWLTDALISWGIVADRPVTEADLAALRDLRGVLRRLTERVVAGEVLTAAELFPLNAVLAAVPVAARIEPDSGRYVIDMTPVTTDPGRRALREAAGAFAAMLRIDPGRLRICARPGCGTVFWDGTRSRTRAWCDNRTCGNQVRVSRHRAGAALARSAARAQRDA